LESGGLLPRFRLYKHAHDVAFLHDQLLDDVYLDFGARPLAEQHAVANLVIDRMSVPVLSRAPGPTAMAWPCCGFSLAVSGS